MFWGLFSSGKGVNLSPMHLDITQRDISSVYRQSGTPFPCLFL